MIYPRNTLKVQNGFTPKSSIYPSFFKRYSDERKMWLHTKGKEDTEDVDGHDLCLLPWWPLAQMRITLTVDLGSGISVPCPALRYSNGWTVIWTWNQSARINPYILNETESCPELEWPSKVVSILVVKIRENLHHLKCVSLQTPSVWLKGKEHCAPFNLTHCIADKGLTALQYTPSLLKQVLLWQTQRTVQQIFRARGTWKTVNSTVRLAPTKEGQKRKTKGTNTDDLTVSDDDELHSDSLTAAGVRSMKLYVCL